MTIARYKREIEEVDMINVVFSKSAKSRKKDLFTPSQVFKILGHTNAHQLYDELRGFGYIDHEYHLPTPSALVSGYLVLEVKGDSRNALFWSASDLQCLISTDGLRILGASDDELRGLGIKIKVDKHKGKPIVQEVKRDSSLMTPTQAAKLYGLSGRDFNSIMLANGYIEFDEDGDKIPAKFSLDEEFLYLEVKELKFPNGDTKMVKQILVTQKMIDMIRESI